MRRSTLPAHQAAQQGGQEETPKGLRREVLLVLAKIGDA
jgi:hypothetical protein